MNSRRLSSEKKILYISRFLIWLLLLLFVYLFIFVILTSFKTTPEFYNNLWSVPKKFHFENYYVAWTKGNLWKYFLASITVVATTTALTLIFSALAAYALARLSLPLAGLIFALIIGATVFPSEAVFLPAYLLANKTIGNGNYLSLIIPYTAWGLPLSVYIYHSFFKTLPAEMLESARLDGCGEIRVFTNVALPIMLPASATVAILTFVGWWGELLWASVDLSTVSLKTLPLGVTTFTGVFGFQWGELSAAICIVLIPLIIFFLFTQKYFIEGLTGGAIKG